VAPRNAKALDNIDDTFSFERSSDGERGNIEGRGFRVVVRGRGRAGSESRGGVFRGIGVVGALSESGSDDDSYSGKGRGSRGGGLFA